MRSRFWAGTPGGTHGPATATSASTGAVSGPAARLIVPRPLNLPFDPIDRAAELWREHFGESGAMAAATSIMRVQQLLIAEFDAIVGRHRLTFARYEALVLLTFSRTGALPLSKIGERLMVHPTSVTNTIDRLEAAGLVQRQPNPRDGRGRLAAITPRGREVVRLATADLMAANFGMDGLDDAQLGEMFTLLRRLRVQAGDFAPEPVDNY